MTGEELYNWAVENIHGSNWRLSMLIKLNEEKISNLSKKELDAIVWFCNLISQQKFFQGSDPVIRVSSFNDVLKSIKEVYRNANNNK